MMDTFKISNDKDNKIAKLLEEKQHLFLLKKTLYQKFKLQDIKITARVKEINKEVNRIRFWREVKSYSSSPTITDTLDEEIKQFYADLKTDQGVRLDQEHTGVKKNEDLKVKDSLDLRKSNGGEVDDET